MPRAFDPVSLHDLDRDQLRLRLVGDGLSPAHAATLWRALYHEADLALSERTDFAPPLRRWLAKHMETDLPVDRLDPIDTILSSDGRTRKFLFRLRDGQEIETVLMGYPGRFTICLSTQAGCAMGCVFCATGQMGFTRQLRPGEIVAQVLFVQRLLKTEGQSGARNVVLMGMGEPLHNYDAVIQALRIISDNAGLNVGPSRITVSTVGVIPGILRLAEEAQPYNLAVSLHATTDQERSALIPVNHRWPLAELIEACRAYGAITGRRVLIGWTLIEGRNDSPAEAERLAALLQGMDAHVNLIRLNPTSGYGGQASGRDSASEFHRIVQKAGIPCTIRQRRGIDVAAGCGQLRAHQQAQGA